MCVCVVSLIAFSCVRRQEFVYFQVIESLLEKSLPNTPSPDMESLKCQLLEKDQSMKSLEVRWKSVYVAGI